MEKDCFFAGSNHVAIQVIASENEHHLVTTNPKETIFNVPKTDEKQASVEAKKEASPEPPPS